MKQMVLNKKWMMTVGILLFSLGSHQMKAQQQPIVLDLETALEIALSDNPTVKIAEQEIEKKQYAKKGAYANLFPQINFGADYSRTLKRQRMYLDGFGGVDPDATPEEQAASEAAMRDGIEVGRKNNWGLGFTASMPLVNASLWKSLSISGLDVDLAVEQARSSRIDMVNQVKKSFYNVMLANDSYRVFLESYDNAMQNYLDVKQKYDQGLVAEYDLIRADVSVRNIEPNVFQAENAVILATWQLKALLAIDLDLPIICKGELTDYEDDMYTSYIIMDTELANNTTLRQIDIQTEQLRETIKLQKYEYLPTLSLSGSYNWNAMNNDFKFKNYQWNPYSLVGVSLSIPIFSGGSKYNNIRQSRVSLNQINLQREDTQRNLELGVKQNRDNMSTSLKQFNAAQKGVEQAERGYAIAQKRYETGAGTLLELNDAELALTQSRLNFNQAIYDYKISQADLERILGEEQ